MRRPLALVAFLPGLVLLLAVGGLPRPARAAVACSDFRICEEKLWRGSTCEDGYCTNPFEGGCLRSLLDSDEFGGRYAPADDSDGDVSDGSGDIDMPSWIRLLRSRPRTCHSEDPPSSLGDGLCSPNRNGYPEVRLWSQNWESAFVLSWMMQIIYSELLGVPSTIETGVPGLNANFYDRKNRMDYGKSNRYEMLQNAHDAPGGDCGVYAEHNAKVVKAVEGGDEDAAGEEYRPCAHANMEIWAEHIQLKEKYETGAAEPAMPNGIIGAQGWHVTRSSIMRDPSLVHHLGLEGEANRRKLAETFKRPTAWGKYCEEISPDGCATPDNVTVFRPPAEDGSEDGRYFVEGAYTGFFRATEKNDCNATVNCTGHITDYPCGWTSYIKQQTRHLGIALEASDGGDNDDGYTYGEIVEIWNAANATKSDLIGIWWVPDATANSFQGSGSDLMPVILPTPTQECLENRVDVEKRCAPDATDFELYGDEKGACDEPSVFLMKVAVGNFQSSIAENANPKSRMSPAYDVYKDFSITTLQLDQILTEWTNRGQDKFNFDLRFATCKWMVENLEEVIESVIPPSHPQIFERVSKTNPLAIIALVFSCIAIMITLGVSCAMGRKHHQGKIGRAAQIEFLALLLAGLLLVSVGSLLMALEPTNGTCVASVWMINVGYITQLVPTMIRVSAILKIVRASRKMKFVTVDKKKLIRRSLGLVTLAAAYCAVWTIMDPPRSQANLKLSKNTNDLGETIVSVSHSCNSESTIWFLVMFGGQAFLLIGASVLAWQMRSAPNVVNDSTSLAMMIYSSFVFLVLRFMVYIFSGALSGGQDSLQKARSLFSSLDTIANIGIFFLRFFLPKDKAVRRSAISVGSYTDNGFRDSIGSTAGNGYHYRGSDFGPDLGPNFEIESHHTNGAMQRISESSSYDAHRTNGAKRRNSDCSWQATNSVKEEDSGTENLRQSVKSEISLEEEKEEEDSPMIRYRMKDQSIAFPKWVVEKYGEISKHESEPVLKHKVDKAKSEPVLKPEVDKAAF